MNHILVKVMNKMIYISWLFRKFNQWSAKCSWNNVQKYKNKWKV